MPEGPRGGPRPLAECNTVLIIGFETFEVPETKIDNIDEDTEMISNIIEFFSDTNTFNTPIQPMDIESDLASVQITIDETNLINMFKAGDEEPNKIEIVKDFFEEEVGLVNEIALKIE